MRGGHIRRLANITCLGLWLALTALPVVSDDVRPLSLSITEQPEQGRDVLYRVQWQIPPLVRQGNYPGVKFPSHCQAITISPNGLPTGGLTLTTAGAPLGQSWLRCQRTLAGQPVAIRYPKQTPALSSMVTFTAQSGERHNVLLPPGEAQWQIPAAETPANVAWQYTQLGAIHIWIGIDHLLFVLCLLWIAGTGRRMLITLTGFTVAHSFTLALSALNLVCLPLVPVEALIALSIVFLAVEIVKNDRQTLTWRYPVAVSSSFGLLHGFGFAAALSEIGLPQTELLTGLLFFNVGVEIGQVLFAGGVIALMTMVRAMLRNQSIQGGSQQVGRLVCSYGIGSVASFWLVERCMGFFPM